MTHLKKGDQAPDFIGKNENGADVRLSDYKGKKLALYFYPRDLTPTCTEQACSLRDGTESLSANNIYVVGVNDDPASKHQKFIEKHTLSFPLIADTEQNILKLYGVWGPKKFMGKTFDGTHRTTFLIDEDGKIVNIIDKVKAKEHTAQVLEGFGL